MERVVNLSFFLPYKFSNMMRSTMFRNSMVIAAAKPPQQGLAAVHTSAVLRKLSDPDDTTQPGHAVNKAKSKADEVKGKAEEYADKAKQSAEGVAEEAKSRVGPEVDKAKARAESTVDGIKHAAESTFDKAKHAAGDFAKRVKSEVTSTINKTEAGRKVKDTVVESTVGKLAKDDSKDPQTKAVEKGLKDKDRKQ